MSKPNYSTIYQYTRNGGAYDRGRADSYYARPRDPHYYRGRTNTSEKITVDRMSADEIAAYNSGYNDQEADGNKKDY